MPGERVRDLMRADPALVDDAIDRELYLLEEERVATCAGRGRSGLRRGVAEVRRSEASEAMSELMYLRVCSRFRQLGARLVSPMREGGQAAPNEVALATLSTNIHSQDALAQLYVLAMMFGHLLRNVDAKFQLEKSVGAAAGRSLQRYLEGFGPGQLEGMARFASLEAQLAAELHVRGLFGDLRTMKEELMGMLAQEADALGSKRDTELRLRRVPRGRELPGERRLRAHPERQLAAGELRAGRPGRLGRFQVPQVVAQVSATLQFGAAKTSAGCGRHVRAQSVWTTIFLSL